MRILLVDDHEDTRKLYKLILETRFGCEVVTGKDGIEALQQALREHPDLVIMDFDMPFVNGIDAARYILSSIQQEKIPVVLVSNQVWNENLVNEAKEAGCLECLSKDQFLSEMPELLERYRKGNGAGKTVPEA